MSVAAGDLFKSAEKIHNQSDCEADWRATCARAYYAVYNEGRLYHEKLSTPGALDPARKGGKHEDLYTRLQNPTIKQPDPNYKLSRRLGFLMQELHTQRVIADYKPENDMSAANAANSVSQARTVLDLIAGHNAPPLPPKFSGGESSSPAVEKAKVTKVTDGRSWLKVVK
jgi:hypothetical protein